ncbi:MAG: hypothetical protein ACFE96_19040, partial [Candidatus Hermodarchaeota archaeon]
MLSYELIVKALKCLPNNFIASTACYGKNEQIWNRVLRFGLEKVFNDPNKLITVEQKGIYNKKLPDLAITDLQTDQVKVVLEAKHAFSWDIIDRRGQWDRGDNKPRIVRDLDKLKNNLPVAIKKTAELYFLLYIVHFHTLKAPTWVKYGEHHNSVINGRNTSNTKFNDPTAFLIEVKNTLYNNFGESN